MSTVGSVFAGSDIERTLIGFFLVWLRAGFLQHINLVSRRPVSPSAAVGGIEWPRCVVPHTTITVVGVLMLLRYKLIALDDNVQSRTHDVAIVWMACIESGARSEA
jgi:hypothetical protein